jgi:hypothetical protein
MLRRTVTSFLAACALVLSGTGRRERPDPDGPLPGYTIHNPLIAPLAVGGRSTRVLQGVHRHAAFAVEIPPDWNGQLAM